jgi:hypothetical protein
MLKIRHLRSIGVSQSHFDTIMRLIFMELQKPTHYSRSKSILSDKGLPPAQKHRYPTESPLYFFSK